MSLTLLLLFNHCFFLVKRHQLKMILCLLWVAENPTGLPATALQSPCAVKHTCNVSHSVCACACVGDSGIQLRLSTVWKKNWDEAATQRKIHFGSRYLPDSKLKNINCRIQIVLITSRRAAPVKWASWQ